MKTKVLDFVLKYAGDKDGFIPELLVRLISEKPSFFTTIQIISGVIGGLSWTFTKLHEYGLSLPPSLAWIEGGAMQLGAITAIVMAQLPNKK